MQFPAVRVFSNSCNILCFFRMVFMMNTSELPSKNLKEVYGMNGKEIAVWCAFNGIIAFMAIVGNLMVIAAFVKFNRLRTRTNYFVMGLSIADVLVGVISIPMWVANLLSIWHGKTEWLPTTIYRVFIALDVFSGVASILHLMIISLERLYAIGWPVEHRVSSRKSYQVILVGLWCASILVTSLFVPESGILLSKSRFYVLILCFFFPLVVICATYTAIWCVVRKKEHDSNYWNSNKEAKLAATLFLVIVLFVVAWLPFMVINIVAYLCRKCISSKLSLATKLLHYSNSAVNPIVYAWRLADFRTAFLILLFGRRLKRLRISLKSHSSFDLKLRRGSSFGKSSLHKSFRRSSDGNRRDRDNNDLLESYSK